MAVRFRHKITGDLVPGPTSGGYAEPYRLVTSLLAGDPEIIARCRRGGRRFRDISPTDLKAEGATLKANELAFLCSLFRAPQTAVDMGIKQGRTRRMSTISVIRGGAIGLAAAAAPAAVMFVALGYTWISSLAGLVPYVAVVCVALALVAWLATRHLPK